MDAAPTHPPSPAAVGPAALWRLADRRSRKAGSGNIFSDVKLWQLQSLFSAAGDHNAAQRARLVWGHRDEAELAQALMGLRARNHRRKPRANAKDALGSHWLRAFNHLRIDESLPDRRGKEAGDESDPETEAHSSPEPCHRHPFEGTTGRGTGAPVVPTEIQGPAGSSERAAGGGSGARRGGENGPERYLHRILH